VSLVSFGGGKGKWGGVLINYVFTVGWCSLRRGDEDMEDGRWTKNDMVEDEGRQEAFWEGLGSAGLVQGILCQKWSSLTMAEKQRLLRYGITEEIERLWRYLSSHSTFTTGGFILSPFYTIAGVDEFFQRR